MLMLLTISYLMRRIEIAAFQFENLITYGGLLFLLLAGLHLFVSERMGRTSDAK